MGGIVMIIENIAVTTLKPYAGNARTHSKKQIRQIAKSIKRFGFNNPVLVGDDLQIIAGHGRVEAAKLLGMENVPVVRLSHLSEADKRAYVLADNKLAEKAGGDREILAIELQGLIDVGLSVEDAGFEIAEADLVLARRGSHRPIERAGRCHTAICAWSCGYPSWVTFGYSANIDCCAPTRETRVIRRAARRPKGAVRIH